MASNTQQYFFCVDCMEGNLMKDKYDLNCSMHSICADCAKRRIDARCFFDCNGVCQFLDCGTYHPTPAQSDETQEQLEEELEESEDNHTEETGLMIFVDNSNNWIEAKKLQAKRKNFKTSEDPRIRIDIGELTDLIANGRPMCKGILYGSEPPKVDSVWEKIREKGWEVETKTRSKITGKEKQVDTQLVATITKTAINTPTRMRGTIVVVTGDADIIPALEEVIEAGQWKLEIYMWKHAIAKDLKEFEKDHKNRVQIIYLDKYLSQATFTNRKFDRKKKLKGRTEVVLSLFPKAFKGYDPDESWLEDLEVITQWPFQHYWYEIDGKRTDHLVLVFTKDKGESFDVDQFLSDINKYHSLPKLDRARRMTDKFKEEMKWRKEMEAENVGAAAKWSIVHHKTKRRKVLKLDIAYRY